MATARTKGPAGFSVVLTGDKELDRMLAGLPATVQKKPVRKALRACAKIVLATARQMVPVASGRLKRSLRVRAGRRTRKNVLRANVQTSGSDNLFTGEAYYGGMVEFGTQRMPGKPFMRPAADRNRHRVKAIFISTLRQEIPKLAKVKSKKPR